MRSNEPVRPYGRYGWQTVNGFFETQPAFGFDGHSLFGVPLMTHWLYGSFQVGESDTYIAALKHYNTSGSLQLLMYQSEGHRDFSTVAGAKDAYRGGCYAGERDGKWGVWDVRSSPDDQRFTLNVDTDGTTQWLERGLIDVVGSPVGDVMQSTVMDVTSPMIYTSRCLRAEGTALGERVSGYFFQDFHHLPPGRDWLVTEFFNGVQGIWVVSVTEYEDGSTDIANFFWGRDGFASALVQRSTGERLATIDFHVEVDFDTDDDGREYVAEARFVLAPDEVWRWNYRFPDSQGPKFPPMKVEGSPHWNEGVVTKIGDERPWRRAEAWMEIYPSTLREELARKR